MKSNASVKRILRELRELATTSNPDIAAVACEDELFEWIFAIRGAWGSEFEGGIYIGRIHMPAEYPFKPPGFTMLTPSGRFEINTKICLSISSYHPESWQPSWSVESALVALIAFMQTEGGGAIGSLDCPKEDRRAMAAESRAQGPRVGCAEKQALVDSLHAKLMGLEEQSRRLAQSGVEGGRGGVEGGRGDAAEGNVKEEIEEDVSEAVEEESKEAVEEAVEEAVDVEETAGAGMGTDPGDVGVALETPSSSNSLGPVLETPETHVRPETGGRIGMVGGEADRRGENDTMTTTMMPTTTPPTTTSTTTILMTSAITIFLLWHLIVRVYTRRQAQSQLDAGLSYSWTSPDIISELVDDNREL